MSSEAPGEPGIPPRWTSSAKTGIGGSLTPESRVWYTLSHGIVDEVYYPRIDRACTRDFGLLVSDDRGVFLEEKRDARSSVEWLEPGVPCFVVTNALPGGLTITKEIVADPRRSVLLQRITIDGSMDGAHVTALLAPHIANRGGDNTAWVGEYKGHEMLYAAGSGTVLALAADVAWRSRSVGYVGVSDGWQDVRRNGRPTWRYTRAGPGNVALSGEIETSDAASFTLAVAFGSSEAEAGQRARASLAAGIDSSMELFRSGWREWHESCRPTDEPLTITSRAVLRAHESISFPGATIASLSIPWGFAKGDDDLGGYHLVWPRDMVETIGGLLAAGAHSDALRGLEWLRATQEADGHWPQNMWLDGSPYWGGVQMDETAFPILAVGLARQVGCPIDLGDYWSMIEAAAGYLVANGPVTGQDRWEEDAGYSPFTLAVEIAALVVAAGMAAALGHQRISTFLLETADVWNESIEHWIYVTGTSLAAEVGVDGYYVRIAPSDEANAASPAEGWVPIKNRPPGEASAPASAVVSPDALALVRFGLRDARDERITNTVRVIDQTLRSELPAGPAWRRYTGDGYGEHEDGSPFDGTGVGRPWPLLTGERAHYAVACGDISEAERLLDAMRRLAGATGLLPEQVWDGPPVPDRELEPGGPTGSAMPLVWAHAEYLKLIRSLSDGTVFDTPPETVDRYRNATRPPLVAIWAPNQRISRIPPGRDLRLHLRAAATVVWTTDDWRTVEESRTSPVLGIHVSTLATGTAVEGTNIVFTTRSGDEWLGENITVTVSGP